MYIAVSQDEPNAQDEYDGYIGRLYELLVSKAPDVELVEQRVTLSGSWFWRTSRFTKDKVGLVLIRRLVLSILNLLSECPECKARDFTRGESDRG